MAKLAVARTSDLEPVDRLEEKIRLLVDMVTQLRAERIKATDENARLGREVDTLRARLADVEGDGVALAALRDEREGIRSRVVEMLSQLEAL